MESKIPRIYSSKVDLWLLAFILLVCGGGIVYSIGQAHWVSVAIQVGILLIIVLFLDSFSYEIKEKIVLVKSFSWIVKEIPIESITEIIETNNPVASPAASLDRLEIVYGKYKSIIISPEDKTGFIDHLKSISPTITVKMRERNK
ncbi:PH domain-containing protein [Muricauda sp. CAU 1633]|uniref:PH domain-containing protein n=1 Tax=Allomuricauda sp. CAU 1633 TaxID=2816036 RepID=UPI001A8EC5D7|nr:PH domain-containing protein [Muricauda sp. CAU 1633]MBO0322059.1 PH domain-containing protein [Muricauda sp. CAU 1633]